MSAEIPPVFAKSLATALKAEQLLLRPNPRLEKTLANSDAKGLPAIAVTPQAGQFLAILCQLVQAKNVLEIGTLGGYSTICFAESVPGVHVTSIEFNPHHREVAIENAAGLNNIDFRLGAALEVLPKLHAEGKTFDFVFIDASWEEQREYYEWAVKMSNPGGIVYVDNVVREVLEEEDEGPQEGYKLIEHVKQDTRVDATLIPTLGNQRQKLTELLDGFLLARVK